MIATAPKLTPFYCHTCGRMEGEDSQTCPDCGARRQHVSRFEWFLADAIEDRLRALNLRYQIEPQYRITDPRSFTWYFDMRVDVYGRRHVADLIEVNGASHLGQKTRDDEKWRAYRDGCESNVAYRIVANRDCRQVVVSTTAARIVADLIRRAGL